jgi:hypothetical protein
MLGQAIALTVGVTVGVTVVIRITGHRSQILPAPAGKTEREAICLAVQHSKEPP